MKIVKDRDGWFLITKTHARKLDGAITWVASWAILAVLSTALYLLGAHERPAAPEECSVRLTHGCFIDPFDKTAGDWKTKEQLDREVAAREAAQ